MTFCADAAVVCDGDDDDVDLYVVLDGLTTGFDVANVALTVEFNGRIDVTVVYGVLVAAAGLVVSWPAEYTTLLAAVELGTLNWTVGRAVCGLGLCTAVDA